ncbi:MAG: single-stranded-DNA-specific exonuclease RecJ [Clostridiales bacterium]|nr:single-stranded-DNA-specific exonuclease RecJ [Clostridiales bacterium]
MAHKKWIVADADKEKASVLSEQLNIDPFIAFLLVARGINDAAEASDFLSSGYTLSSPFLLKDMDKAVSRIEKAFDSGERICIYGDYDCDGVTSTSLLYTFFESMGADVFYYIPNRLTDGYGMNKSALDYIKENGANLIVTVDNGIAAIDEAEYIYELGMELVVTDHHQIGKKLPRAEAVINPHREDNDIKFRDFAGVGVAFKLACALYDGDVGDLLEQFSDLVAIGTIGDMVSLVSENRCLVRAGLELLNNNSRIGTAALRAVSGNNDTALSATDVAFQICPRINAVGRMDNANIAVELFVSDDYDEARFKAEQLNTENIHRHEVESNILDDIHSKIDENPQLVKERVIVISGKDYHHGVIGIVASHIVDEYSKPAIVIGIDENGSATGSARSVDGFNIYDAISSCSECLTHFGGHPMAAGIGLPEENIDAFRKKINDYALNIYPVLPVQSLKIDCKLSPFYLSTDLVDTLDILEPYGTDNTQPVFGLFNMKLISVIPIGEGKHIRLEVQKKNKNFRIVKFRTTEQEFPYKIGESLDFAVRLSKNIFKGREYLSIIAIDIRKNGLDDDKYFTEKSDYELFELGFNNKTNLLPSRDICSVIYRFLKQNNGWSYSFDDLYFELASYVTYGQLIYALDAFEEARLINRSSDKISLVKTQGKADLDKTTVIQFLKRRMSS